MTDPAPNLLTLPAAETARRLALARLEEWDRARSRLNDPADQEALHDFRVALRRLRSLIRAFRPACPDLVPRRSRRRLRRLARATGAGRDLEVQLIWLQEHIPVLTPAQREEAGSLLSRLETEEEAARKELLRRVERDCSRLHRRLQEALTEYATKPADSGASTATVVASTLAGWTGELEERLSRVHAISDEAEAHAARILIKRIRYLLEPFQAELPGAETAIARLTSWQDLLGLLHDLLGMAGTLREALRGAALEHAEWIYRSILPWSVTGADSPSPDPPKAGGSPAALLQLVRDEAETLFARVRGALDAGEGRAMGSDLRALESAATGAGRAG